jgi:general secretion pathway protein I
VKPAACAQERGFTLIEVLVALAVVTLGMAALLGTLNSAAGTAGYLQDKTLAEWIALNQVATVRLSAQGPSKGSKDGEVDYAGRKWKWTQTIDDMPIPGVLSIVVKVRPSDVVASGDNAWYADVTGVVGDAVGAPRGDLPNWSTTPGLGTPGGTGTQGGAQNATGTATGSATGAGAPSLFNAPMTNPPLTNPGPQPHQ